MVGIHVIGWWRKRCHQLTAIRVAAISPLEAIVLVSSIVKVLVVFLVGSNVDLYDLT